MFIELPNTRKEDLEKIIGTDFIIERAYEELDSFAWSNEELWIYTAVGMKTQVDVSNFDREKAKGRTAGRAKGREEEKKKLLSMCVQKDGLEKLSQRL